MEKSVSFPLVSVIIPAYNAATTIEEAINSVFSQTYPNIEIIVIDDGSVDDTESVLQQRYSSSIIYIKKRNGGHASARNAGTKIAKGKFIAWLDADDIFKENKIANQLEYLQNNPEVQAVASEFSAFNENGIIDYHYMRTYYGALGLVHNSLTPLMSTSSTGLESYKGNMFDLLLEGNFFHPPTLLFRREILENAGPQREDLGSAADYEYILRLSLLAPLALIDEILLDYRISEFQDSSPANALKNWPETIKCLQVILDWTSVKNTNREKIVSRRIRNLLVYLALEQAFGSSTNAMATLMQSLKYGPPRVDWSLVLLKILSPKYVINLKRKLTHS